MENNEKNTVETEVVEEAVVVETTDVKEDKVEGLKNSLKKAGKFVKNGLAVVGGVFLAVTAVKAFSGGDDLPEIDYDSYDTDSAIDVDYSCADDPERTEE